MFIIKLLFSEGQPGKTGNLIEINGLFGVGEQGRESPPPSPMYLLSATSD